jgi:hypothetical protein
MIRYRCVVKRSILGVGVLDVPFTLPAASAKTSAGVSTLHVLYLRPSWP